MNGRSSLSPTRPDLRVTRPQGYWNKEAGHLGGIFHKRWVVVDYDSVQDTLAVSWYEKPNGQMLNGLQLKREPANFHAEVEIAGGPM